MPRHPERTITRLPGYDYRSPGVYFVTACTRARQPVFGRIAGGRMTLTEVGAIAQRRWLALPQHHRHVMLDAFVVMPDHVHGIVVITGMDRRDTARRVPYSGDRYGDGDTAGRVLYSGDRHGDGAESFARPVAGSLPTVIRSYKSAVTRLARRAGHAHFAWQGRFYERVVRSERELQNVRRYIAENPARWTG